MARKKNGINVVRRDVLEGLTVIKVHKTLEPYMLLPPFQIIRFFFLDL